jgi:hypothetical protein
MVAASVAQRDLQNRPRRRRGLWQPGWGRFAAADGYVGYMEPYATPYHALDQDAAFRQEVPDAAHALCSAVRAEDMKDPGQGLPDPTPK